MSLPLTADESKARGAFLISRSATLRSPFRTEKLGLFETNAVPPASAYSEISKFPNPFCFDHPIARMMKTTLSILFLLLLPLALFANDKVAPTREKLTVSTEAWTGQKLPAYPSGQPEISILKITIPPGQRLPMLVRHRVQMLVHLRQQSNTIFPDQSGRLVPVLVIFKSMIDGQAGHSNVDSRLG